jgi:hypothetical protein
MVLGATRIQLRRHPRSPRRATQLLNVLPPQGPSFVCSRSRNLAESTTSKPGAEGVWMRLALSKIEPIRGEEPEGVCALEP